MVASFGFDRLSERLSFLESRGRAHLDRDKTGRGHEFAATLSHCCWQTWSAHGSC